MIPLFDLHCDTLTTLYKNNYLFENAPTHISKNKASIYSPYIQICAIWSDFREDNEEAFNSYSSCLNFLKASNFSFSTAVSPSSALLLSVEGARILNNRIERLYSLYNDGVRLITLSWKDSDCIGGGWNTTAPLTLFGKEVVKKCAELGIAIDMSHSSLASQKEVIKMAHNIGFSPIYSHSNSFSVCPHDRNVKDDLAKEIVKLNGLIGISLCSNHLHLTKEADLETIVSHIEHFLTIGCENILSLGCDFDGTDILPRGIKDVTDLTKLYFLVTKKFGDIFAKKLFFENAFNYFSKHLERR